jgi:hypothetical protein
MKLTRIAAEIEARDSSRGSVNWGNDYDISETEAERIAAASESAIEFEEMWEDADWWKDEKNPIDFE